MRRCQGHINGYITRETVGIWISFQLQPVGQRCNIRRQLPCGRYLNLDRLGLRTEACLRSGIRISAGVKCKERDRARQGSAKPEIVHECGPVTVETV